VEELEKQVADLTSEKNQLLQSNANLSTENMFLKSQVESLKAALGNNGAPPSTVPSVLNRPAPSFKQFGSIPPVTSTSGLLFMILLFSFGIIFGNMHILNQGLVRESAEFLPGRIFVREEFQPLSSTNGEGLKTLAQNNKNIPFVSRLRQSVSIETLPSEPSNTETLPQLMDIESIQRIDSPKTMVQDDPVDPQSNDLPAEPMFWNPNATYLSCPTVHQITPPKAGPWSSNQEQTLIFLIPPDSLGLQNKAEDQQGALQVTCQVTEIKHIDPSSFTV